jgi:hypothetical protein
MIRVEKCGGFGATGLLLDEQIGQFVKKDSERTFGNEIGGRGHTNQLKATIFK